MLKYRPERQKAWSLSLLLLPNLPSKLLKHQLTLQRPLPQLQSIVRPLLKFSLSNLLCKVSGIMLLVCTDVGLPDRVVFNLVRILFTVSHITAYFVLHALNGTCAVVGKYTRFKKKIPIAVAVFFGR